MRVIHIKAAAPGDRHRASGPSAAKTSGAPESAGSSKATTLLTNVIHALLKFVSTHRIERTGTVPGDGDRFACTVRINPRNGHKRGHDVAHRITARILGSCVLHCREGLKATLSNRRATGPSGRRTGFAGAGQERQFKIREHTLVRSINHNLLRVV